MQPPPTEKMLVVALIKREERKMDEIKIPYIAHEAGMARLERANRRLWILCIILIVLLFGSNAAWFYYENQFEDVVVTQENADGYNNYVGNDGDITN